MDATPTARRGSVAHYLVESCELPEKAPEMIAPLASGAPLCRVLPPGYSRGGSEIMLKGGRMGGPLFLSQARAGRV
jgi:hypothetical protein